MFSPFTSSSSSGSARAAASSDPDHLFVFDSLPLASSLMSDFEMGTALSSSAYALDAGSMSALPHHGGHHQAFHAFAHDLSSSSGSDPESGSDSPVHDELIGSGGSSALYGHAQPHPALFQLAPHAFSASAMAGDSQAFHLDDLPPLVPHPLSTTPLGGAVLPLTPSSSSNPMSSTATAAAPTATTTTTTRRRKKGSSSSPPGSNHVSPTPVALHHLAHPSTSTGMMPSVLSSASSSALAFSAATHLHNNPFLSSTPTPLTAAGTVSLMAAGAASASSAPSSASSKKASAASSMTTTATTKRRKTTTKSKKDKDTSNDDDDLAAVTSSHTAGLDLSSADGVVSVPAQKLRKLKEDAELKRKRLDRKAELARNSRRKKKQRVVELEEQVAQLQAQLTESHLRAKDIEAHCQILTMQTQNASAQIQTASQTASDALAQAAQVSALHRAAQTQVEQLQAQLQQHARQSPTPGAALKPNDVAGLAAALAALSTPDVVINEALNQLRASPAGGPAATQAGVGSLIKAVGDVTALTRHAMELMEKLLTPCMPVRVLRWALSQSDKFYADPNGLWSSLLRQDCGVTAQQMVALDDLRASFKAAAAKQHTSLAALYATTAASASASAASTSPESASVSSAAPTDLWSSLLQAHRTQVESNEECLRTFATILTGEQMMKFLAWVERYGSVVVRINV